MCFHVSCKSKDKWTGEKLELYNMKSVEEMTKQLTELSKENDNIRSNAAQHERHEGKLIKEQECYSRRLTADVSNRDSELSRYSPNWQITSTGLGLESG